MAFVRLIVNIILFLASLLCIFVAPTFRLWIASIVASEFSWMFAIAAIGLLVWSIYKPKWRPVNTLLATLSIVIFMMPVVMAWQIGRGLPEQLEARLGNRYPATREMRVNAFSFSRLVTGINADQIAYERLSYKKEDDQDLTMDFYNAAKGGTRPCIVVIHGGSWCGGDSEQLPELNSELAKKGYHVASINYRLAPKYLSPAPIQDIENALKFLREKSYELKIDTNNFILLGRSAGAQLAMVAAYTLHKKSIRGVVNFYGPSDMVWGYSIPSNPLVMDAQQVMEDFLGGPFEKIPQIYVESSPVEQVNGSNVPTLIIHGENDALVAYEHSERLVKKLSDNKIPHYLLTLPWATHGCDYTLNGPSGQLTTYAVEYFVRQVIQPSTFETIEASQPPVAFESSGN